jgi:Holliday junction resolvase-like predicted endonuclease
MAADHFYKIKLEEDNKTIDALRKVDNAHEEKHRQQAEYFESQKREWEKIRDEYEDIIQEYENK